MSGPVISRTNTPGLLQGLPIHWRQYAAIALCALAHAADGFDTLAMAFAGPSIARELHLKPAALGEVFGVIALGVMAGSFLIAPLADRFGRRLLLLGGALFMAVVMACTPLAHTVGELIVLRFLTGVGVGMMSPNLTVMVTEYANGKRGPTLVSFMQIGFSLGVVACSTIAGQLIGPFGWRSIFLVGAGISAVVFLGGVVFFRETPDFLNARRPHRALERINATLALWGHPPLEVLVERVQTAAQTRAQDWNWTALRLLLIPTLLFAAGTVTHYFVSQFYTNWTPKIMVDAGIPHHVAVSAGALTALGGGIGTLLFGQLAGRRDALAWIAGGYGLGAVALLISGVAPPTWLIVLPAFCSFFLVGALVGLMIYAARYFPPAVRGAGMGLISGVGRLGGAFGAYTAGVVIGLGWTRAAFYPLFAGACVIGALAMLILFLRRRSAAMADPARLAPEAAGPTLERAPSARLR
jgi:AAHS family 4-hydroxybenzoate transporter-like MFS transporter